MSVIIRLLFFTNLFTVIILKNKPKSKKKVKQKFSLENKLIFSLENCKVLTLKVIY